MGEDDLSSPHECVRFMKEHFPKEKTENFEIVLYPKAGHLIEPPYTPLTRMSYHKTWGMSQYFPDLLFVHILTATFILV